jgi:thiol-disulfide isomerase/thioredoxin
MSQLDKDGPADVISEYVDRWVNERLLRQLPEEVTPTHSSALGDPKLIKAMCTHRVLKTRHRGEQRKGKKNARTSESAASPLHRLCGHGNCCSSVRRERLCSAADDAAEAQLPAEGELPSLGGATGWLNSQPSSAESLRGKVVLAQFCTYTCINWLRTLPYLRAWAETYKNSGLVVLGVHTPEFAFEKDVDNVRRALKELKVGYPIALDNDYAVWRAFHNNYWPALYLSMRRDAFGIITSVRAITNSRKGPFNSCWPRLEWVALANNWLRLRSWS